MTDKRQMAIELFSSVRGRYVVGQALYLAIQAIEARPKMEQEPSNVADMRLIMEQLFPMYASLVEAKSKIEAMTKKAGGHG